MTTKRFNKCNTPRNQFYNWMLALFGGGAVAATVFYLSQLTPTPARVIERAVAVSAVGPGEDLRIDVKMKMYRKCDAIIAWWVIDAKDEMKLIGSGTQPGQPTRIGTLEVIAKRKLPDSIQPGSYIYKAIVFDACENGEVYTTATRIPFTVR